MKNKIILPVALLMLLFSCKNTGKPALQNNTMDGIGDLIEDDSTMLTIVKISDTEYRTPDGDMIILEKPFLKVFEGEVDGQKVQAYINNSMASEEYTYSVGGHIYIEDTAEMIGFGLEKTGPDSWRSPLDDSTQEEPYQYEFELPNTFVVIKNGHKYPLLESEMKYEVYDVFDYRMVYCTNEGSISYTPHWEYNFQAVPVQYSEKQASLFKNNPFKQ